MAWPSSQLFGKLGRRLSTSLALVLLLACGPEKPSTAPTAPNRGRGKELPKAPLQQFSKAPLTESHDILDEDQQEVSFRVRGGHTFVQHESELYLIEPSSLAVLAKIASPDGSSPACIVSFSSRDRFLLVSQSGLLSLWESNGTLIAKSQRPIGHTTCVGGEPASFRVSWDIKHDRFLTNFDQDPSLSWAGVWVWRINGTALEPTRITPGKQWQAEFLEQGAGAWVARDDGSFQIVTLEGKVLHSFTCEQCVPSPNGQLIAVNQFNPRRHTRLMDLRTGSALWESTVFSAHVWSPSMRWLLGTDDRGPLVIDASDGRIVARWAHSKRNTTGPTASTGPEAALASALTAEVGGEARWFGDLLVETDANQVVFWKSGDARAKVDKGVPYEGLSEIELAHGGDRFLAANTVWSVHGKRLVRLEALAPSRGFAQGWSADDRYLDGKNDEGLVVWDSHTGRIVSRLEYRMLDGFVRSWSLQGHELLINEGRTLIRHTPEKGTVRITPQLSNGKLSFDLQEVASWP